MLKIPASVVQKKQNPEELNARQNNFGRTPVNIKIKKLGSLSPGVQFRQSTTNQEYLQAILDMGYKK